MVFYVVSLSPVDVPAGSDGKESASNARDLGSFSVLEKGVTTHSSILPGKPQGQRSLMGYSPRGHKESDVTEQLTL